MDGQTDGWVAGWMDVWNFTPMFYRTLALLGRYPKRLTKFFGRSSYAKYALPTMSHEAPRTLIMALTNLAAVEAW